MAHDYEDMHNIEELEDGELRDLVREQLAEHPALDLGGITVLVASGHVTLTGRVGTNGERRIAEHVLTDVLGVTDFTNDLVVDAAHRSASSLEADEYLEGEEERGSALLGDIAVPFSAEAEHLADELQDDIAGTTDYTRVMELGVEQPSEMTGRDLRFP